jgi:hypothetical protein
MLKAAAFGKFHDVSPASRSSKAFLKGDGLLFKIDGMSERFTLTSPGGEKQEIQVEGHWDGASPVVDENCRSFQIVVRPAPAAGGDPPAIPFFLGSSCAVVNKVLGLAISFPREVEFTNSTIFETKGKGEKWRYFELGSGKRFNAVIGKLTFEYQGKSYDFNIESFQPSEAKKPEENPRTVFSAGLGLAMDKISGSDINASDAKPALILDVPYYPLLGKLGINLNFQFAIPLGQGASAISLTQFQAFATYELALGSSFHILPELGYVVFSESNDSSGVGLSADEPGFGLALNWAIGSAYSLGLNAMTCGIGSSAINSHYSVALALANKKPGSLGWGFGARLQSFKATSGLGIQRQFAENLLYAFLSI